MKKISLLLVILLLAGGAIYLTQPAIVFVGSEKILLKESKGEVLFKNTVGDIVGYGRCTITDLSLSWAPYTVLKYNSWEGVIFSTYAVEALMKMDKNEAYAIAQKAFDRLQEKSWRKKGKKLLYPLQILPR